MHVKTARRREIFGWAMYDIANQAYTTVVISFIYGAFFVAMIVPESSSWQDSYWSLALIGSMLLAMVLSPVLGQAIDRGVRKKQLLAFSTAVCVVFTAALWWVNPGQVWLGVAVLLVSNTAWMLGEAIVATFLPSLAQKRNMGMVSGLGWGLGYIGGLLSMAIVALLIITADPNAEPALYVQQHQWAMVAVAVYFVLFSIPTFVLLKEHPQDVSARLVNVRWQKSFNLRQVAQEQPVLMRFLWAFLFYMAGVQTVIKFIGIFTSVELGLSMDDLLVVFLATQISAMLGAIGFGFVERWLGARLTLLITIGIWLVAIISMIFLEALALFFERTPTEIFTVVALLAGTGIGSIQASSRSMVGQLAQDARAGSAFGLWGFFMRAAAILAAGFGVVADVFNRQQALLLVVAFFILGAVLLLRVPLGHERAQPQKVH